MNFHEPRNVIIPERIKSPDRPGNYTIDFSAQRNGGHRQDNIGVITLTHEGFGRSTVCARTSNGSIETLRYVVDYERQDEAWDACIRSLAEKLRVHPEDLSWGNEKDKSWRNALGFGMAMSAEAPREKAADAQAPYDPSTFEADMAQQALRREQGMPPGRPNLG